MKIAYGYQISGEEDPLMKSIVKVMETLNNSGPPASTPPEIFPWCERVRLSYVFWAD